MRKIICVLPFLFFTFVVHHAAHAQDSLANTSTPDSTLHVSYKNTFIWNNTLFRSGNEFYTVQEVKPLMKRDKKVYFLYNKYKINTFVGKAFETMSVVAVYRIIEGAFEKKNVLPAVCAVPVSWLLSNAFHKWGQKNLQSAIQRYNTRL